MAVRIRLTRLGRKKQPFYRIIVADSARTTRVQQSRRGPREFGFAYPANIPLRRHQSRMIKSIQSEVIRPIDVSVGSNTIQGGEIAY